MENARVGSMDSILSVPLFEMLSNESKRLLESAGMNKITVGNRMPSDEGESDDNFKVEIKQNERNSNS